MRRIRNIGLAVLAALALSAVGGAGSASAAVSGFTANSYPAVFQAKYSGEHFFKINIGTIGCETPLFQGEAKGPTKAISSGSASWAKCAQTTLKPNGCQYTFRPGAEQSKGIFGGSFEIGPAGCGPMTMSGGGCEFTIGAQAGLAATYENLSDKSGPFVRINANATNLEYTQTGTACKTTIFKNGGWVGSWEVSGHLGASIGLQVDDLRNGLYLVGEKSEEKASQPRLEAETYPATVLGAQDPADQLVFGTNSGTLKCGSVAFGSSASGATTQLALTAQYGDCWWIILFQFKTLVSMNSCHYTIDVLNAGPPYAGSLGVACGKEGDAIKVLTPGCTFTIPPQSGLGGLALANAGAGSERNLLVDANVSGIEYTETKGSPNTCKNGGQTSKNGTLKGGLTLDGWLGGYVG